MNLTNDQKLSWAICEVREHLLLEPDALREDKQLRAVTASWISPSSSWMMPMTDTYDWRRGACSAAFR